MKNAKKNDIKIKVIDIINLASTTIQKDITAHSMSTWLKTKTDGEYVVFSRDIIAKLIKYALQHERCYENDFVCKELTLPKEELEYLRDYWL